MRKNLLQNNKGLWRQSYASFAFAKAYDLFIAWTVQNKMSEIIKRGWDKTKDKLSKHEYRITTKFEK